MKLPETYYLSYNQKRDWRWRNFATRTSTNNMARPGSLWGS